MFPCVCFFGSGCRWYIAHVAKATTCPSATTPTVYLGKFYSLVSVFGCNSYAITDFTDLDNTHDLFKLSTLPTAHNMHTRTRTMHTHTNTHTNTNAHICRHKLSLLQNLRGALGGVGKGSGAVGQVCLCVCVCVCVSLSLALVHSI